MSLSRRTVLSLLAGACAALPEDRRSAALAAMEQVMGPLRHPTAPADVITFGETKTPLYGRRKITFDSGEGDRVPAWLLVPYDRRAPHPAAVCLHQTTRIGKDEPAGLGGKDTLHYAAELAERGYVAIAPDYPNYGEYKIDPYAMGYVSATMKGIVNHRRAVDVLSAMPEVDAARIAAVGHSLGGHNSLFLAAFDQRVAAVVTSCGFTSFRRYMHGNLAGWSHRGYMPRIADVYGNDPARMPFEFTDVLLAIAPRALFINAPKRDANFDVEGVRETVAAVKKAFGKRLEVVYPDAEHDFPAHVHERAWQFLDKELAKR